MPSTMLTSKGQITLPVEIRKEMGLKPGDRLEFRRNASTGTYEMTRKTCSIMDLKGLSKYDGPPVTVEQMNRDIAQYLADDDERIKREYREYLESERRS
jgi:AbrB family looped-hinge helix DNA binding protein